MSAPSLRVLVCGGRDLEAHQVWNWLEQFAHQDAAFALGRYSGRDRVTCIIHGGARGADEGAARWGQSENIPIRAFKADWKKHGKAAGPIRNGQMIREGRPDVVIAFEGGRGTADMCRQASDAGIPIVRPAVGVPVHSSSSEVTAP